MSAPARVWLLGAALLASCSASSSMRSVDATGPARWTYRVAPYLWIPTLAGDVPDGQKSPVDVDLVGIDDLESGAMAAFEMTSGASDWSLLADSIFVRFDEDEGTLQSDIRVWMSEVTGAYHPPGWNGVEVLAGLRHWYLRDDFDLAGQAGKVRDVSWVDPLIGMRASHRVTDICSIHGRADVAGFGIEADWSHHARIDLRWSIGEHAEVQAGYRYLLVDFNDVEVDVRLSGPLIGFAWSF